jgi:hypothetical protein
MVPNGGSVRSGQRVDPASRSSNGTCGFDPNAAVKRNRPHAQKVTELGKATTAGPASTRRGALRSR